MNVKLYYAPERDTAGRPVTYSDGGRFAGFVRRGRIESYYTRADGSAAITMEYLGVSPDGLKVELWSALEDDPGDALDSRAAACGDERGYAAASEAAARTTSDSRQFVRALAAMPEELAAQGYRFSGTKDLSVREWTCPLCGRTHDRDVNAARNIRDEGMRLALSA